MAFQNCPGVAQLELQFNEAGWLMENVLHAVKSDPWSESDLFATCEAMDSWAENHWSPIANAHAFYRGCKATDLSSETGAIAFSVETPTVAGGVAATNVPTNVTACVTLRTALRGKSYRGRMYWIGLSDGDYSASVLTTTARDAIIAAVAELKDAINGGFGTWCVLSRVHDKALRAEGIGTPITVVDMDRNLDSQRRRLPGRGT
jgi:hypothetical protein